MTTQRFEKMFAALKEKNEGAFVAFVNLCDPTEEMSLEILETLAAAGVDALELGIPFSDPCADGPVIMQSAKRALDAGAGTAKCMNVIEKFRDRHPDMPVSIMIYANLVFAARRDHLPILARASAGYVYLLSRPGITGANNPAHMPAEEIIEALKKANAAPGLLGFGVSTCEHVRHALQCGAAGVIVGSAIVRIINEYLNEPETMLAQITDYVRTMKAATRMAA